jgi:hypothetical protein
MRLGRFRSRAEIKAGVSGRLQKDKDEIQEFFTSFRMTIAKERNWIRLSWIQSRAREGDFRGGWSGFKQLPSADCYWLRMREEA